MVQIDRMEIDDAGSDPKKLAKAILDQLPDDTVLVPVREIAKAIDIYEIREERLSGLEGALIVPKEKYEGAILINKDRRESRKRYTIAHELGHYVHPFHRANSPDGFRCKKKDMTVTKANLNDPHSQMEQQANEFAAELLMPARAVASFVRDSGEADLSHILKLALRHDVSREAAARRYISQIGDPAAVVFSEAGFVRYARINEFFPKLSVSQGDQVPQQSVSALSSAEIGKVTDCVEVAAHTWLQQPDGVTLFEQTLSQQKGFRMTLLTAETPEAGDVWKAPAF